MHSDRGLWLNIRSTTEKKYIKNIEAHKKQNTALIKTDHITLHHITLFD